MGTLLKVMQTEVGGRINEFINDPSKYHYALNKDGQRIAGHTGKVSTAFGPFGILESTAAKPGYGVNPLQSKDLMEQIRFAGDYLGARVRHAGSLEKGLAGYGEGAGYAAKALGKTINVDPKQVFTMPTYQPQDTPTQNTFNPQIANQWNEFRMNYAKAQQLANSRAGLDQALENNIAGLQGQVAGTKNGMNSYVSQLAQNANQMAGWGQRPNQQNNTKQINWGWV